MPILIKNVKTGDTIWCKRCGKEGRILALYSGYDSEDFTITGYMCKECDAEEDTIEAIATDDWNEVCKSVYGEKKEGSD